MKLLDCYTLTVTPAHRDCAAFYRRWFAFTTVFEAGWITVLASAGERPFTLGFMAPDHPSTPPGPAVSRGEGTLVTLQVADARAEHARLAAAGAPLIYPLTDEPWGPAAFRATRPRRRLGRRGRADRAGRGLVGTPRLTRRQAEPTTENSSRPKWL